MGDNSPIQWTDHTFNPWIGCRMAVNHVTGRPIEECFQCYAKLLDDRRYSRTLDGGTKEKPVSHWGSGPRHRTSEQNWKHPLAWNRKAGESIGTCTTCGSIREISATLASRECLATGCSGTCTQYRPRVFCGSLCDWLDYENVPLEWFAALLRLIHDTPHLDWLLLTKRPQNWRDRVDRVLATRSITFHEDKQPYVRMLWDWVYDETPPANVWIGVSAGADQETALAIPARVHFLSCEPMLGPLDTTHAAKFDWIIFGGESGSKARACHTDDIRDGIAFCRSHGVKPFLKQLGSNCFASGRDQKYLIALKDSHGGVMEEWPEDLRVREFPIVKEVAHV